MGNQGDEIKMSSKGYTNDSGGSGQKGKAFVNSLNIIKYFIFSWCLGSVTI